MHTEQNFNPSCMYKEPGVGYCVTFLYLHLVIGLTLVSDISLLFFFEKNHFIYLSYLGRIKHPEPIIIY